MFKKYFIIVFLLYIAGSGNLWADHIYGYTLGIPTAVLGCGVVGANYYLLDTPSGYVYGLGALLAVGGLAWLLYDMLTHPGPDEDNVYEDNTADYFSQRKINPIIEHLSFGIIPNQVYIGVRFKF
jgi:hypothetical protein